MNPEDSSLESMSLRSWETLYRSNRHLSVWPWTDVVRLTSKVLPETGPGIRVLELGFGAGANVGYFHDIGVEYWGIEGSQTIVAKVQNAFPTLKDQLVVGDFTEKLDVPGEFDLILDRGSLTHNGTAAIKRTLESMRGKLKTGGHILGVDWFSTEFDEYQSGQPGEDLYTRTDLRGGRLDGTGIAHFCDEKHIHELLSNFSIQFLEHKTMQEVLPSDAPHYAAWNFIAKNDRRETSPSS